MDVAGQGHSEEGLLRSTGERVVFNDQTHTSLHKNYENRPCS